MSNFEINADVDRAAQLIADGKLTLTQIAAEVGVTRQTIGNWQRRPEFKARIQEHLESFFAETRRLGLAILERRVRAINDRWNRLQKVIEERANDPEMQKVAGGSTGLLAHRMKCLGSGADAEIVDEYEVDTGLLKELREHEKQAAQELGQWVERANVEHVPKAYVSVSPDEM